MVVMTKNKNNNNNPEKNYTEAGILIFTGYLTGQNYEVGLFRETAAIQFRSCPSLANIHMALGSSFSL